MPDTSNGWSKLKAIAALVAVALALFGIIANAATRLGRLESGQSEIGRRLERIENMLYRIDGR